MTKTAVIVGGGIAGSAMVPILLRDGWNVRVFERANALPAEGTALGMWPQALSALDEVGVGDVVRSQSVEVRGAAFLRPDGSRIASLGPKSSARLVPRPALLDALSTKIPAGLVEFGVRVDDVADLPDCDVLIAADGINSVVRSQVFGTRYDAASIGAVAFRGTVEGTTSGMTETWGRGRLFGTTPHDGRRVNWFGCVRAESVEASVTLAENFGSWHDGVADIVARVDIGRMLVRELQVTPSMPTFVTDRVAVVGDAAHAMAPNLGRGACEALLDAVALARALVSAPTVSSALKTYDAGRRRPSQRVARASSLAGAFATARGWRTARDLVARGVSAAS